MNMKKIIHTYIVFLTVFFVCCLDAYSFASNKNSSDIVLNEYVDITSLKKLKMWNEKIIKHFIGGN